MTPDDIQELIDLNNEKEAQPALVCPECEYEKGDSMCVQIICPYHPIDAGKTSDRREKIGSEILKAFYPDGLEGLDGSELILLNLKCNRAADQIIALMEE